MSRQRPLLSRSRELSDSSWTDSDVSLRPRSFVPDRTRPEIEEDSALTYSLAEVDLFPRSDFGHAVAGAGAHSVAQREQGETGTDGTPRNATGLPDRLKTGIESLSGMSLDDVRVHFNSSRPAQLQALAYTQGAQIHVAPGQERSLPHEAWHLVQQAQGRVTPTMRSKDGVSISDDASLEQEADVMGAKALGSSAQWQEPTNHDRTPRNFGPAEANLQRSRAGQVKNPFMPGVAIDQDRQMEAERMGARGAAPWALVQPKPAPIRPHQPVVQRLPADFDNVFASTLPANTGPFRTSHWEPLLAAIDQYRQLLPGDLVERQHYLNEMAVHLTRWRRARGLPGRWNALEGDDQIQANWNALEGDDQIQANWNALEGDDLSKAKALDQLELLIGREHTQLGASPGNLIEVDPVRKPDPRLTRPRDEKDGRKKGYFFEPTPIFNDDGIAIATAPWEAPCRIEKRLGGPRNRDAEKYCWVRPAPSEDSISGAVKDFPDGWVEKTKVQSMSLEKDASKELMYEDRRDVNLFPLFPVPPTVADVRQSSLGDCYLLAAVLAIVRRDPQHFPNHMRDNGDGTVTVKLYQIWEMPGRKPDFESEPVEIMVNKSAVIKASPKTGLHQGYNKGTLWVEMLEKAYAAAGFTGDSTKISPSRRPSWSDIASGKAFIAFNHLTGKKGIHEDLHSSGPENTDTVRIWTQRGGITGHLFEIDESFYDRWIEVNDKIRARILELYTKQDEVRLEHVKAVITEMLPNDSFRTAALGFLDQSNLYPGKRGSGHYTATQLTLFKSIADSLDQHERMVVGTKDHMKRGQTNFTGQSANESVYAGLAGPHGYELIDYLPANFRTFAQGNNGVYWIKLRNPWGKTGREYVHKDTNVRINPGTANPGAGKMKPRETNDAEFWITLEDLTKRFQYVSSIKG